jgi:hypothetical protein
MLLLSFILSLEQPSIPQDAYGRPPAGRMLTLGLLVRALETSPLSYASIINICPLDVMPDAAAILEQLDNRK